MKLPLNSTKKYTQLPEDIESTVKIISNRIGEVESYKDLSLKYKDIIIAQIKEKKEHPDADKLAVYMIDTGIEESIQVVAGDKTLEVGDKVVYIKPGGIVPSTFNNEPFEIKSVKMRGVLSNGMMCSQKELDIGPNHENVLKLEDDAPIGEDFANYYNLNDVVVDIENKALTNRGDLFGILGLSRELAGAQGIKFESPNWYKEPQIMLEPSEICINFDLDNQAEALCPRYCAIAMADIKMNESPIWLKSILLKSGIKPINIVVDITNYLMILTGQPLHAFDFDKVVQTDTDQADMGHIVVRTANNGEKVHALDGSVYKLNDRHLVIANSQHPIAIAGVVGGVDTQIDENSKNIIIESANFDRYNLRRTSMELGIVTEASTRFTRSQSPESALPVLARAVELISELTDGKLASTLIDSYPVPQERVKVSINIERMFERLGIDIAVEEVVEILESIEYKNIEVTDEYISVEVPSFRQDIQIEEDIYEDIIRIYGYDKVEPKLPTKKISSTKEPQITQLKGKVRDIMANSGSNELISYSFTNTQHLKSVKQDVDTALRISNPLSRDLQLMRPSILSSLLEKAKLNTQQGIETFSIFEIGISHQRGVLDEEKLPLEEWKLGFLFTDSSQKIDGNTYYQSKRYLEKLLNKLSIRNTEYTLLADADFDSLPKWIKVVAGSFESNSSAIVYSKVGDTKIELGIVGEISLLVKKNLSLNDCTSAFEINLEKIKFVSNETFRNLEESKFPYITQDITFIVPDKVTYRELYNKVKVAVTDKNLRSEIECMDIYKKEDDETRSITLRISVSHTEKTLKDKDFKKIREKIEKGVKKLNISM